MNKKSLALLILLLSACQSINEYATPPKDATDVSYITGYDESDGGLSFNWVRTTAVAIDNKATFTSGLGEYSGYGFSTANKANMRIYPGQHKVTTLTEFNTGFGGSCPCYAYADLEMKFIPNKQYQIKTIIDGALVKSWVVEESSGKMVSSVAAGNYMISPKK